MSNIETNWVLNLIDQVTGPIKDIFNSTSKLNTEFDQTDKKVKFTGETGINPRRINQRTIR